MELDTENEIIILPDTFAGVVKFLAEDESLFTQRENFTRMVLNLVNSDGVYYEDGVAKESDTFILYLESTVYFEYDMVYSYLYLFPKPTISSSTTDKIPVRYLTNGIDKVILTKDIKRVNINDVNSAIDNIGNTMVNIDGDFNNSYIAMDINMLNELANLLSPQRIRSYLHMLSLELGPDNMMKMLPPEIIDIIADDVYFGRARHYPSVLSPN